jgi:dGTPase
MNWEQLLDNRRFGEPRRATEEDSDARTPFDRDQDRLLYSIEFRRLGGKTQVFPLPESDETHTRLTHTLEVASAGRSIGRLISQRTGAGKSKNGSPESIGAIVSAACFAHDIGNPPFGHSGEAAIAEYFTIGRGQRFAENLSVQQREEIGSYEGNAAGFRIITTHGPSSNRFRGFGLTHATLGAFMKYPRTASAPKPEPSGASQKKYGMFEADSQSFDEIAEALGLLSRIDDGGWCRHPLAFAMEAADDLCYRIIDLEDAYRLRLIGYPLVESLLRSIAARGQWRVDESRLKAMRDDDERVGYLRAKAIGALIYEVVSAFEQNEGGMLAGTFDLPLTDVIDSTPDLAAMKDAMKENVYGLREVIEVEAAGFEVLGGLLDIFLTAVVEYPASVHANKVCRLMAASSYNSKWNESTGIYATLLSVAELVGGMTDYAAIDLYRKLKGIELPNY